jgi:hypothetical protein
MLRAFKSANRKDADYAGQQKLSTIRYRLERDGGLIFLQIKRGDRQGQKHYLNEW